MLAFVGPNGQILAVYDTPEHAEQQISALGLQGLLVPVQDGADPLKLKVKVAYKLEKFAGDVQSPDTLIETIEG